MVEASADNSKYWTDEILFQAMLGIWFAAAHQPWIVGCLLYVVPDMLMIVEPSFRLP